MFANIDKNSEKNMVKNRNVGSVQFYFIFEREEACNFFSWKKNKHTIAL